MDAQVGPFKFTFASGSTPFKQTIAGSALYVSLRLLEVGIVLWAIYTVFKGL
jgi:hypothetical protein